MSPDVHSFAVFPNGDVLVGKVTGNDEGVIGRYSGNGDPQWSTELGAQFAASVNADGNVVIWKNRNGVFVGVLSGVDGSLLWGRRSTDADSCFATAVAFAHSGVVRACPTEEGTLKLQILSWTDGEVLWQREVSGRQSPYLPIRLYAGEDQVLASAETREADYEMTVISSTTGEVLNRFNSAKQDDTQVDWLQFRGDMWLRRQTGSAESITMFDVARGTALWTVDQIYTSSGLTLDPDREGALYISDSVWDSLNSKYRARLRQLDPMSGMARWTFQAPFDSAHTGFARPVVLANSIVLSTSTAWNVIGYPQGTFFRISREGRELSRAPVLAEFDADSTADETGDHDLIVARSYDAGAARGIQVRRVDPVSGATRWTSAGYGDYGADPMLAGSTFDEESQAVAVSGVSSVTTSEWFRRSSGAHIGAIDARSGEPLWSKEFTPSDSVHYTVSPPFSGGSGHSYAIVRTIDDSPSVWPMNDLISFGSRNGLQGFSVPVLEDAYALRLGPVVDGELLDPQSGRRLFGFSGLAAASEPGGDIFTASASSGYLTTSRFRASDFQLVWYTQPPVDVPYAMANIEAVLVTDMAMIVATTTKLFGSGIDRVDLLALDLDTGEALWRGDVNLGADFELSSVRMFESGGSLFVALRQRDFRNFAEREVATELDRSSGRLVGYRSLESTSTDTGNTRNEALTISTVRSNDSVLVHSRQGTLLRAKRLIARRLALNERTVGDLSVVVRTFPYAAEQYTPVTVEFPSLKFEIDVKYVGDGQVGEATLEVNLDRGTVIDHVTCVAQSGACGEREKGAQLRLPLTLSPGGHIRVIVDGTMLGWGIDPPRAIASISGPFELVEPRFDNNSATGVFHASDQPSSQATVGHSGSWFDPEHPGEGWILEVLEDGRASLVWFTFPSHPSEGVQKWFIAQNGRLHGDRISFNEVFEVSGGAFGQAFNPANVVLTRSNPVSFVFDACNRGTLYGLSPASPGFGRSVIRLTKLSGTKCEDESSPQSMVGAGRSGAWLDPARGGEGWVVESIGGDEAVVYWFTFDPQGKPAWLGGKGRFVGNRLHVADVRRPVRVNFDEPFGSQSTISEPWGMLDLEFVGCNQAIVKYSAIEPAWGAGSYGVSRLTAIGGVGCE